MKKIVAVLLSLIFVIGCFGTNADMSKQTTTRGHSIGVNISGFNAANVDGSGYIDSSILEEADITVLNFWSTGCGPCVAEMPDFQEAHEYYTANPDERVQIIGVVCVGVFGCTVPGAVELLEENGYTYLNIVMDTVLTNVMNSVGAIPQTLIVDSEGNIHDHIVGRISGVSELYNIVNLWKEALNGGECTVTFVNEVTEEVIQTIECPMGTNIATLDFPEPPEMEGYTFSKWSYSGDGLHETGHSPSVYLAMGDVTVTAEYNVQKYKVKFYDGVTNALLKIQLVPRGQGATAPQHPEHEGYTFTGWDTDFSAVYSALNVHGVCVPDAEEPTEEPITEPPITEVPVTEVPVTEVPVTEPPAFIPGDANGDGVLTGADALIIARVAMGVYTIDNPERADYNGDGSVNMMDAIGVLRFSMGLN